MTKIYGHFTDGQIPGRLRQIAKSHKSLTNLRSLLPRELEIRINSPDKNTGPFGRRVGQRNRRDIKDLFLTTAATGVLVREATRDWKLASRVSAPAIVGVNSVP